MWGEAVWGVRRNQLINRARLLAGEAGHVEIECPIQRALHIDHWRPHCRLAMGQSAAAIGPDHITKDFVQVDQAILDKELSFLNILVRCYLMCIDAAKHCLGICRGAILILYRYKHLILLRPARHRFVRSLIIVRFVTARQVVNVVVFSSDRGSRNPPHRNTYRPLIRTGYFKKNLMIYVGSNVQWNGLKASKPYEKVSVLQFS